MTGWICLHRKLTEWEWYTDANTMRLFIHCLLKANHTDKKWRGIIIERGSFITSYDHLATELKLSVKQIRTALDKLKRTSEVASKATSKYSIITVLNYDSYQDKGKQEGSQGASKGQTKGKQRATTNNDNNDNNENKKDTDDVVLPDWLDVDLWDEYLKTRKKLKCVNSPRALNTIINKLVKFESEKKGDGLLALENANSNAWKNPYRPKEEHAKQQEPPARVIKPALAEW